MSLPVFFSLEAPKKKMAGTVGDQTSVVRLRTKTSLDSLDSALVTPPTKNQVGFSPPVTPEESEEPGSGSSFARSFLGRTNHHDAPHSMVNATLV